jgi:hypothetical protein
MVYRNLLVAFFAATLSGPLFAQELALDSSLEIIGSRQCAIEGSDLHQYLQERLPDCSRFCTVDKEYYTRSSTFSGRVFACGDRDFAALPLEEGVSGLSGRDAAIGLLGLGLLLGLASGGSDGATSDTQ